MTLAGSRVKFLDRRNATVFIRNREGRMVDYPPALLESESVLSQIQEPHLHPELSALRQANLRWRFYHGFRTDPHSPLRSPQIAVLTPVLSHDGLDLSAAICTINEIVAAEDLAKAVDLTFPGATLRMQMPA